MEDGNDDETLARISGDDWQRCIHGRSSTYTDRCQVPNWRKEGEVLDRTITPKLDIMTVRRLMNAVEAIKGILADEHKTRNSSPAPEVAELVADAPVVAKPRKSRAKKVVEIA
jgi:hypothetical protein